MFIKDLYHSECHLQATKWRPKSKQKLFNDFFIRIATIEYSNDVLKIFEILKNPCRYSLLKRRPYSELFWSAFSHFCTEYGENVDQNNSEYEHFSRSDCLRK